MKSFEDRENAFEAKFAHDSEMQFRAESRANRLLGLWAADLLGKSGPDADAFAAGVMRADLKEAGHEDVVGHVVAELAGKADAATVRAKRVECLSKAKAELASEG
ncbi:MAG: DUF1476 domain-containing protein [Paracoccaceae bacterium]|nr:DUF1476 domain-containing protein [Paracoccaceae bacterium]MDE3238793.1 DUF1476 domain-containing protein [Paracoccaceae bacterium]